MSNKGRKVASASGEISALGRKGGQGEKKAFAGRHLGDPHLINGGKKKPINQGREEYSECRRSRAPRKREIGGFNLLRAR